MSNKKEYEEPAIEEMTANTSEEAVERPYTLRKLKDSDLFPLLQILRKIGLKDAKETLMKVSESKNENQSLKEVGIDVFIQLADKIIENIGGAASEDIYAFWSGLSGIPADEIKEMEFGTLPLMIYDSFSEVKNTSFFKVLSKLL